MDCDTRISAFPSSQTISMVRVPLLLMVVAVHSHHPEVCADPNWGTGLFDVVADNLSALCIPALYFLSGLLFFNNYEGNVTAKLKRRCHTLLAPYVLWNLVGLALLLVKVYALPAHYPQYADVRLTPLGVLEGFWAYDLMAPGLDPYPYDFVLWYVRNLMVVTLVAVPVHALLGLRACLLLPIVVMAWLTRHGVCYGLFTALAYFYTGGIFQRLLRQTTVTAAQYRRYNRLLALALPLWAVVSVWAGGTDIFVLNFVGVVGVFACANLYTARYGWNRRNVLSRSMFFVYAAHGLWISVAVGISAAIWRPVGPWGYVAAYLTGFGLLFGGDIALYALMERTLPRLTRLLCGNHS